MQCREVEREPAEARPRKRRIENARTEQRWGSVKLCLTELGCLPLRQRGKRPANLRAERACLGGRQARDGPLERYCRYRNRHPKGSNDDAEVFVRRNGRGSKTRTATGDVPPHDR